MMKVLIFGEFTGIERSAFEAKGHDAWSCDLLPSEKPGQHIQSDVRTIDRSGWDLVICHPDCTYLAISGARWFKSRIHLQNQALAFIRWLLTWPTPRLCIENPISIISTRIAKPSQIIQPWQFGHPECKATCLWLYGLPLLKSTCVVSGRRPVIHFMSPSPHRSKDRSRAYPGIAAAMAAQWGVET